MSQTEIQNTITLRKALDKAMLNGWDFFDHDKWTWEVSYTYPSKINTRTNYYRIELTPPGEYATEAHTKYFDAETVLFDHDFAKALWGDNLVAFNAQQHPLLDEGGSESTFTAWHSSLPAWQYHLQQMVVADDPIAYLGEYLDD